MQIRPRAEDDLDACVDLLRAVRAVDGYPPSMPDDPRTLLVSSRLFSAWVAEEDGRVVGHVSLHPKSAPPVTAAAVDVLGVPEAALACVTRLFTDPAVRGRGVGRSLLDTAAAEAHRIGRQPILDTVTFSRAIPLYERAGWRRVAEVTLHLSSGAVLPSYVFVGPAAPSQDG